MRLFKGRNRTRIVACLLALAACSPAREETHPPSEAPHAAEGHQENEPQGGAGHAEEHEGHAHGDGEASDLDQPVEALFAATCEHEVSTYICDECRYEVGVVKAEAGLIEGGLIATATVAARAIAEPLALTGEVRFDERRVFHVSTQAEGTIRQVHVTLGDRVEDAQPLVELVSVAVGEAEAAYLEARGVRDLARRNHKRLEALRREGIVSERELIAARQEQETAEIRVDAALGKLTRLGVSTEVATALTSSRSKGRLELRAPAAGTVLEMHASVGELARSESSLLTVGDSSAMWVSADLYERDIARVFEAQARQPLAAAVEVKAYPGEAFDGTVEFVSPSMSEASRTVKLRIAVPNPGGRLLAGMFATVQLFVPGDTQALAVPQQAVVEDAGRAFVFVHREGDYYVRRPVGVGPTFGGFTAITEGLGEGDVVVTDGAFLLKSDVLRSKMGAGCAD